MAFSHRDYYYQVAKTFSVDGLEKHSGSSNHVPSENVIMHKVVVLVQAVNSLLYPSLWPHNGYIRLILQGSGSINRKAKKVLILYVSYHNAEHSIRRVRTCIVRG